VVAAPAQGWPSSLDALDPAGLADKAWPDGDRPAEAVGVLPLDPKAAGRHEVSITDGVIRVKSAGGEEIVSISSYAPPPKPAGPGPGQFFISPYFSQTRDVHAIHVAALSPKADRLVVLGHTTHTAGELSQLSGNDASWSGDWVQVWRWEGSTFKPLEVQALESPGASAAAFSPDGNLLATSNRDGTDIWEVGDKKLKHLGKISGLLKQLVFAPDGRSLAAMNRGYCGVYDLGPILPGGAGWARWSFMSIALGLLAAIAVSALVSPTTAKPRAQCWSIIVRAAAFLAVVACVAWWAWRPASSGGLLNVGLGIGAALALLVLLARAPEVSLVAIPGALVFLVLWAWQFWWPSPLLRTPSESEMASADIRSACFSADGSELAALRITGRLSVFDVNTGRETRGWQMPEGVLRPEYASDGRHLLAVAKSQAYVLRMKPFDDTAYLLSCCDYLLEQDPKSTDALLARGHVHLRKGELNEAIADFTQVITLDDKSAAAYHGRGLARTDQGDYAGARDDFSAAISLDPTLAPANERRAP
jgi:hypothetical protein